MPKLRELDLPPPYDPSRIVLTHKQGAMVSDMASGEYAPHWAAWQKTRSGLMSQVRNCEERSDKLRMR